MFLTKQRVRQGRAVLAAITVALLPLSGAQAIVAMPDRPDNAETFQQLFQDPEIQRVTRFSDIITLLKAGRTEEARLKLAEYLKANPQDGAGLELAGLILIQKNDLPNAAVSLAEAVRHQPARHSARAKLGVVLLLLGKTADGEAALNDVLRAVPNDAMSHFYLGWSKLDSGDAPASIVHFEKYFKLRPAKSLEQGHLGLASAYLSAEQYQDAVNLLTPLLTDDISEKLAARANLLVMGAYIETGDAKRAAERISKIRQLLQESDPRRKLIEAQLARVQNKPEQAKPLLTALIKDTPALAATAYYELAKLELAGGNREAAAAELQKGKKLAGAQDQVFFLREITAVLLSNKQSEEAIKLLGESAKDLPKEPWIPYLQAEVKTYSGDVPGGLAQLEQVIASYPDFPPSYYLAGVINWNAGKKAEAEAQFEKAVTLNPKDIRTWLTLAGARKTAHAADGGGHAHDHNAHSHDDGGHANETGGAPDKVQQTLMKALQFNPDYPALLLELAMYDYAMGNIKTAEAGYRKVLESNPDDAQTLNNLALLLTDKPVLVNEAIELSEKAYALAKDDPTVQDIYGWVQFRAGNFAKAKEHIDQAAKSLPDDGLVNYHLGAVYMQAGNKAEAEKYLRRALELDVPVITSNQVKSMLQSLQ